MKKILYPLAASALITIVPFLLTFEKGQDIVRGLFGYGYFALLLLIVFLKDVLQKKMPACAGMTIGFRARKILAYVLLLFVSIIVLFTIAWLDLQNLLAIKGWDTGWYGILPFVTCGFAIAVIWKIPTFSLTSISLVLFATLVTHFAAFNLFPSQPLAQFPAIDYLARSAPQPPQRKEIDDIFKDKYIVSDSASITRNYVDTARSNVIILVESWGVPLDINRFEKQLKIFDGTIAAAGSHHRMYSRTKTAEREDLIYKIHRDSSGHRDTTFLPQVFTEKNYKTTFLFGGNSLEHQRFKYIHNLGFENVRFKENFSDVEIVNQIDNLLNDSLKQFIVWTTRDTKFPIAESKSIYYANADVVDSTYSFHLEKTLQSIAGLAQKHPEVRFIIQGDHNPILSPLKFQERFYKRWVPFIALN
ncbi:hypothetical protein B7988_06715 [Fibrobacter sp. UWB1]|uniref:hypothetical protein n=1 Tax=Fibrobacter sp. UWB1 TaxID=1964355 RepID=UPI000B523456|nr:hypothetical protein [Fibrobacter sp. UWB1]OWV26274.1 hypothetical protein B7988_06715 [Fibrobacter sp. UWB1]